MSVSMVFVPEFLFSGKNAFSGKITPLRKCLALEAETAAGEGGMRNKEGKAGLEDPVRRAEKMNLV